MNQSVATNESTADAVFLARQPIYDRDLNVLGYEILCQHDLGADSQEPGIGQAASSFVDLHASQVVGNSTAFIRLNGQQLKSQIDSVLPRNRVVLEIEQTYKPDTQNIERLISNGFTIAIKDYVHTEAWRDLLPEVQYVKLNVTRLPNEVFLKHVKILKAANIKIIAEHIQTHEQYDLCRSLGVSFFQGLFICRPRPVQGRTVDSRRDSVTRMLAKINDPDASIREINDIVRQDVGLGIRLLRIINSAFYGMDRQINTTQQALALLGMQRLRAWVALLAMSTLDDKPQEILVNCLVRARTAENMARATGQTKPCRYFIAGMLSLLDAVLDQPMDQLVDELPLTPDLRQALLTRKGDVGRALHSIEAQERGAWKHMAFQHLTPTEVQSCWLESLQWTRNIAQALDS